MLLAAQIGGLGHQPHGGSRMGMGDRQPQRVGGIGAGQAGQLQQPFDHFLDLALGCATMADHGFLHLQGGVFGNREIGVDQGRQRCTTGLAQQQRGLGVDVDEDDFHGSHLGLIA